MGIRSFTSYPLAYVTTPERNSRSQDLSSFLFRSRRVFMTIEEVRERVKNHPAQLIPGTIGFLPIFGTHVTIPYLGLSLTPRGEE